MSDILDLHGLKHAEVIRVVDQFLWDQIQKKSTKVEIVTGISDQMKLIVIETVKDYEFTYNEAWNNPGKLIISLV
jgi:hypothetical protein